MCTEAGEGVSFPWLRQPDYTLVRETVVEKGYLEISTSHLHDYGEHTEWPKDVLGEEGSGTPHLSTSGRGVESMHARHRVQRLPAWLHQKLEMSQKCGSEAEGLGAAYTSVRGARMVLEVLNSQIFHSTPKRSVPSLCFLFMGHTSRKWGYVPMFQQCTKHQSTLNCWAPIFSSFWTHNLLLDKGSLLGSSQQI